MTLQKRDILIYNGIEIPIWDDILYEYFKRYPERVTRTPFMITSLWRGYFAEFEISEKNELYIISLNRYIGIDKKSSELYIPESVLDKAFPKTKKCDFFSGFIRIDNNYTDIDNVEFKVLEFDNGNLIKEHILTKPELEELKNKKTVYNNV